MKTKLTAIAALLMAGIALPAHADADHNYDIVGAKAHLFDVYNDGKNTYVEVVRGLIVPGSKRDGDSYLVEGVQSEIIAQYNGKKITIKQRVPARGMSGYSRDYAADPVSLSKTAEQLDSRLESAPSPASAQIQAEVRDQVRAQLLIELQNLEARKSEVSSSPKPTLAATVEQPKSEPISAPAIAAKAAAISEPEKIEVATPAEEKKSPVPPLDDSRHTKEITVDSKLATPNPVVNEAVQVGEKVLFAEQVNKDPKVPNVIKKGRLINEGLEERATAEGWTFLWYPKKRWEAIADIDMSKYKNADEAVDDIITGLREEGKPIQLRVSEGNKVMEIFSTEVKND
ncbi:toxin co-regulated pilus biosynthesis Q family protein [Rugamonas sp. A1-17]|nr:toxin co-regulated pilus biosynthesis Q family protein [Rugamonas sp. A1-17]